MVRCGAENLSELSLESKTHLIFFRVGVFSRHRASVHALCAPLRKASPHALEAFWFYSRPGLRHVWAGQSVPSLGLPRSQSRAQCGMLRSSS